MFVMMPVLWAGNKIDWKDGDNLNYLRIGFVVAQSLTLLGCALLNQKVKGKADQKMITVKKAPAPGQPAEWEDVTVEVYDGREVKKIAQQVLMSFCIIGFLHWKWELTTPLFIQVQPSHCDNLTPPPLPSNDAQQSIDHLNCVEKTGMSEKHHLFEEQLTIHLFPVI